MRVVNFLCPFIFQFAAVYAPAERGEGNRRFNGYQHLFGKLLLAGSARAGERYNRTVFKHLVVPDQFLDRQGRGSRTRGNLACSGYGNLAGYA
ncbi:MAG: hypothetical protein BWY20_02166 [Spirochaetes bacterium ADurb.Bin215]|nr:MAG: hypothetical protein BWY20_02166 [Spirochaetes bacterium ADurb.Bin215]